MSWTSAAAAGTTSTTSPIAAAPRAASPAAKPRARLFTAAASACASSDALQSKRCVTVKDVYGGAIESNCESCNVVAEFHTIVYQR